MNKITEKEADIINELSRNKFDLHYDFLKKILTVSVSLLAIIVALAGVRPSEGIYQHHNMELSYVFALSLSTLALGILCVSFCLYGFVVHRNRILVEKRHQIAERIADGSSAAGTGKILSSGDGKADRYDISSWIGLTSLLLSVIGFTVYLIMIAFIG